MRRSSTNCPSKARAASLACTSSPKCTNPKRFIWLPFTAAIVIIPCGSKSLRSPMSSIENGRFPTQHFSLLSTSAPSGPRPRSLLASRSSALGPLGSDPPKLSKNALYSASCRRACSGLTRARSRAYCSSTLVCNASGSWYVWSCLLGHSIWVWPLSPHMPQKAVLSVPLISANSRNCAFLCSLISSSNGTRHLSTNPTAFSTSASWSPMIIT